MKNILKIVIFVLITAFTLTGCDVTEQHKSCTSAIRVCEQWKGFTDNERLECFKSAFTSVCHVIPDEPFMQIIRKDNDVN